MPLRRLSVYLLAVIFASGSTVSLRTKLFHRVELGLAKVAPRLVFRPSLRGCGRGYIQSYVLLDGRKMAEGSVGYDTAQSAEAEFRALVARASTVIENVPNFKNRFGKEGQRFVLVFPPRESQNSYASIVWYGGGTYYTFVDAPSMDVAIAFERANAYAF